jgi:hypothetical protein
MPLDILNIDSEQILISGWILTLFHNVHPPLKMGRFSETPTLSYGFAAPFTGSYSYGLLEIENKDLPVAHFHDSRTFYSRMIVSFEKFSFIAVFNFVSKRLPTIWYHYGRNQHYSCQFPRSHI